MEVEVVHKQTEAERKREYRGRMGDQIRSRESERMRRSRKAAIPHFIGVDSEGIGQGKNHRAVLISAYDKEGNGSSYTASNLAKGLQWDEVFEFLYARFLEFPRAAFVGFYLSYDFNQWLCARAGFPLKAATSLLTKEGRAARKIRGRKARRNYHSVKVGRWEVDMMGFKRLSIRPRPQNCTCYEQSIKCDHAQLPWMHICDAGPFYQMSFLAVIDPGKWTNDPGGWPVTQAEYNAILKGKNQRATAKLNAAMEYYNKLENIVLARVMERLALGFASIGIKVAKDQWYGPGATASKWLTMKGAPRKRQLRTKQDGPALMPKWFWDFCRYSYFGGWFEIFSHGIIPGTSYNYDINNAYPFATSKLPHVCRECQYRQGTGDYNGQGQYVLLYATVFGSCDRIGPVPYRDKAGNILRPRVSKGWYWQSEIDAARRAGLVKKVMVQQWAEFIPCSHPAPFTQIEELYYKRLEVGKNGAQGLAIKNNNNSAYGKFAQMTGSAPFNNWLYASLITAHCRIQILDAIATHPGKTDSVLMIATDGICFDAPHPFLAVSTKLGEWEASTYEELCLFKPGVYWHKAGKEALLKVKSRGVPRAEFAEACMVAEELFRIFTLRQRIPEQKIIEYQLADEEFLQIFQGWPYFYVPVKFRMKSCAQAINEGDWSRSGVVQGEIDLKQDSDPQQKRRRPLFNEVKQRIDTVIHDLPVKELQTYYHGEIVHPKTQEIGVGFDNQAISGIIEAMTILRDKPANYNLPVNESPDEIVWEKVWG